MMRYFRPMTHSKAKKTRSNWAKELRARASIEWMKEGKSISCKICEMPASFEERDFKTSTYQKPVNMVCRSYGVAGTPIDLILGVFWLCHKCNQKKEFEDTEGLRRIRSASAKGGDVFDLNPYRNGFSNQR